MQRINPNLFPRDGYYYKERDGAPIRSTRGWKDLAARVVDYRRRNGIPAGDPMNDINEQVCQRQPNYCTDANPLVPQTPPNRPMSFKGTVLQWLTQQRSRQDVQLVSSELAAQRANICAGCPFNQALQGGCSACKNFITEVRALILKGRNVDQRLNACSLLSADTGILTHLDDPTIENGELPRHCWKKRG